MFENIPVGPCCYGLILTPQFHWDEESRLLLFFSFGPLPKWLSSFNIQVIHLYPSPFLHLCYCLLSPRAHDTPEFLLKHQIWYFPPHPSSVVNLRDFSFWMNMFDPFFLAQPPLTLPVFYFSPLSNTRNHLSSELPCCYHLSVICVPCTSLSPSPPVNWNLAYSRMAQNLLPCLFFSYALLVFLNHFFTASNKIFMFVTHHLLPMFLSASSLKKKKKFHWHIIYII